MKNLPRIPWMALTFALVSTTGTTPAAAQVGIVNESECRCVDKEGKEIENCHCFRTFEPGQFALDLGSFDQPRARMGITLTISQDEDDTRGARIQSVLEDGPADRAGLREGDIITHIDGHSLFDPLEDQGAEEKLDPDTSLPTQRLLQLARNLEPGDEVEVRYLRNDEARSTTLQAEEVEGWGAKVMYFGDESGVQWRPEEFQNQWEEMREPGLYFRRFEGTEPQGFSFRPGEGEIQINRGSWLDQGGYLETCPESDEARTLAFLGNECIGGLRMEELNPKLGEYFGTDSGALVADVHPDSKLGVEAGDVILGVGDRDATTPDQLRRILRSYEPDEEVQLRIMRHKREMTVSGMLGR